MKCTDFIYAAAVPFFIDLTILLFDSFYASVHLIMKHQGTVGLSLPLTPVQHANLVDVSGQVAYVEDRDRCSDTIV